MASRCANGALGLTFLLCRLSNAPAIKTIVVGKTIDEMDPDDGELISEDVNRRVCSYGGLGVQNLYEPNLFYYHLVM
jgi:hypothetical protein